MKIQNTLSGLAAASVFLATSAFAAFSDKDVPGAIKTANVSTCAALQKALDSATSGLHIVAANGTYACNITMNRSGVVLRAENLLGATLTGTITLQGNKNILYGFKVRSIGGVDAAGTDNKVLRNEFQGWGHPAAIHVSKGSGLQVGYNEFSNPCPWTNTKCGGGSYPLRIGIRTHESGTKDFHYNARVYRNYFHDFPTKPDPSNYNSGQDDAMEICETNRPGNKGLKTGWTIEYNLVSNHKQGHGVIDLKCGGNMVRYNTMINSPMGRIDQRGGSYSTFIANWMENSGGSSIHGRGHKIIGNRIIGSGFMGIMAGDGEWDHPTNEVKQRAVDTLLIGNNAAKLEIGKTYSPLTDTYPALNTRIEAHTGKIVKVKEQKTTIVSKASQAVPAAVKLSPAEVGPMAK